MAVIEEAAREPVSAEELKAIEQNARSLNLSPDGPSPVETSRAMRDAR